MSKFKFSGLSEKKKKIANLSLVGGCLAVVALSTVMITTAYLSAETNNKSNEFKPYTLTDTQVSEPTDAYELDGTGHFVTDKEFVVQNPAGETKKPVFVRVAATVQEKEAEVAELTKNSINWNLTKLNSDYWVEGSDGYFYYKYVLYPGRQTQPLFKDNKVYFTDDTSCELVLTADTVQATLNGDNSTIKTDKVNEAWGTLPVEVITDNTKDANAPIS